MIQWITLNDSERICKRLPLNAMQCHPVCKQCIERSCTLDVSDCYLSFILVSVAAMICHVAESRTEVILLFLFYRHFWLKMWVLILIIKFRITPRVINVHWLWNVWIIVIQIKSLYYRISGLALEDLALTFWLLSAEIIMAKIRIRRAKV